MDISPLMYPTWTSISSLKMKKNLTGVGEVAQQLRAAFTALAKDPGSIPNTHKVVNSHL